MNEATAQRLPRGHVTIEGDRMAGKTETLLALSITQAAAGEKVLYVTLNHAVAAHTFRRAVDIAGPSAKAFRTHGEERLAVADGVIWFRSARSHQLNHHTADMIVLDEYDFYAGQPYIADLIYTTRARLYVTRTTGLGAASGPDEYADGA